MNIEPADNLSEPTDYMTTSMANSSLTPNPESKLALTGGVDGLFGTIPNLSIPLQDLSADARLHAAPRLDFNQTPIPALGGIPLVAKISQGGMGAVYYGFHPRLYKEVAVKVLHTHLAEQNAEMIERFCKEARLAAQIQSQHLVSVLDVNRECGIYYFVMEFVRGPTAQGYLERSRQGAQPPVLESVALDICIAACTGLAAAHAEGIIHRDVKPGNILIPRQKDADGLRFKDAKLADLGLARNEDLAQGLTGTGVFMGTPGYMAPEQALDMKQCGTPADVFGMGATLYALLAGFPPFKGVVWTEPAASIQKSRPEISARTTALLQRCLEKAPEPRYACANELLDELRACRDGLAHPEAADAVGAQVLISPRLGESPPPRTPPPTVMDSSFRAETQRYEMRQALFIAIPEAKEAKARQDWKQVVELLDMLCSDPNNADHPSKKIADALLAQARVEVKKLAPVERQVAEASKHAAEQTVEQVRLAKIGPLKQTEVVLAGRATLGLVLIPAGTYMMGSPDSEAGRNKDELRHKVTISKPFYIGRFCVTQEQYDAVMEENPSQFRGGTLPVEGVSWDDAARFCAKVEELAGRKTFLPSEAQWEYACRAGTTTPFHFGTTLGTELSNYDGHYAYGFGVVGLDRKRTTIAGTFKPNAFGLYDMHGNVWEWCADFYNEHYYRNAPDTDPPGPISGKARVLRGGSWLNPPADCRSANRGRLVPNYRGANVGFRIAMQED